ncbi:MAG: GNAT family N-acetyltransferase [Pyrinomonadaceae bacterium]
MAITSGKIEIRQASVADARLISVLATATFYEAYYEQDAPHDLAAYIGGSFSLDQIEREVGDPYSTFFIIFLDEKAVGYAKLIAGSRDPSIATTRTIELKRIYILERVWRRGIGEKLLAHCLEAARRLGNESIWLGVWEQNGRGRGFYKKQGFVQTGTLEFPYGDSVGINYVMEKKL